MNLTAEQLRSRRDEARLERDTLLEHRGREGEDPASSIAEVPSVDELVVHGLRDDMLEARGQLAEFSLARLAARASGADARAHRLAADRVEFELLREIAADVPALTIAVWQVAARLQLDDTSEQ